MHDLTVIIAVGDYCLFEIRCGHSMLQNLDPGFHALRTPILQKSHCSLFVRDVLSYSK